MARNLRTGLRFKHTTRGLRKKESNMPALTKTLLSISALGLFFASGSALAQNVTNLPSLGGSGTIANDINDMGEVVGQSTLPGGLEVAAVRWDAAHTATNLGSLPGSTISEALAINNNGTIVGFSEIGSGARLATLWDGRGGILDMHAAIGATGSSIPWDINDNGVIVGQASITAGIFSRGFVWDQVNPALQAGTDFYQGGANFSVNNAGEIVGAGFFFGDPDDALLAVPDGRGGYEYPLINPFGFFFSQARAINNTGMIIGHSGFNSTTNSWNAAIYTGDSLNPVTTLGSLPFYNTSEGLDVNDNGMVVGYSWDGEFTGLDPRAWVWTEGTMYDLNDLLGDHEEFEILSRATAVNNNGDIVGFGRLLDGSTGAFLIEGFTPPAACPADMNGDGALDFFDISTFLTAFGNGDLSVDINGDGALDFFDISAFLTAFAAGCP